MVGFEEAGAALGLSSRTIQSYCSRGSIPKAKSAAAGYHFATVAPELLPGEVFKNVFPEEIAHLQKKPRKMIPLAQTPAQV